MMYDENGKDLMNKAVLKANDYDMDNVRYAICASDFCRRFITPFDSLPGTDKSTKNKVVFSNGRVMSQSFDNNNVIININFDVMPDIVDVQTIEKDGEVKVVTVYFADGTNEKAVLSDEDTYSLEQGISICITKKLLSDKTAGYGSAVYNKIIKRAMKVMDENKKRAEKKHEADETLKAKLAKLAKKKADKKAKREAAAREEAIAIQAEAYLRAMREFNNTPAAE